MKILIVVLVIVAILFAIGLGLGSRDMKEDEQENNAMKGDSPGWVKVLEEIALSRMPKVKLSKSEVTVSPDAEFKIEPLKGEKIRILKLAWSPGAEVIVEFKADPPLLKLKGIENPQVAILADFEKPEKFGDLMKCKRTTLLVFEGGGTLKFKLASTGPNAPTSGVVKVEE